VSNRLEGRFGEGRGMLHPQGINPCRVLIGLALAAATPSVGQAAVFPEATWEFRTPAQVGMDAAKLDQFAASIGGVGCVVRDGYMVKTWGSQTAKADWASASKPVLSTMLFFAIKEGKLASVDALVADWGWAMNAKDQPMTFRHLANMISGYSRSEAPGAAWAYNDYAITLYVKTIYDRVYGTGTPDAIARAPARLGALQFEDGSILSSRGGYGLSTSVRDFARIGWFWLNKGEWNGTQLLARSFFDDYMKPYVPPGLPRTCGSCLTSDYLGVGTFGGDTDQSAYGPGIYGFNWWFNAKGGIHPDSLTWPDAPLDTFQANGHFDQEIMTIIPSLRLVVSARGNWGSFQPGSAAAGMNQNLKLLAQSVLPGTPLIGLSSLAIPRSVDYTTNLPDDTFSVSNSGTGTLNFAVSTDQPWLNVAPSSGSTTGPGMPFTISYSLADQPIGTHVGVIEVRDNGSSPAASNSPQVITVTVTVHSVRPDLDADGDVDQEDFGRFQACLTDHSHPQIPPECIPANLNGDDVIDQADFVLFYGCISGPGVLADAGCDDAFP
jgi:CubicO group peptidase (beta-lactamase class C family)